MATKSQSEINLVITGNSEAATKALSEVSKMLSDMATVVGDTAKSFTEIGQSMSNAVSTVSRDSSALSTGLDGISKTSANVTRSLATMAQEAAAQTKAVDLGFEEVAKTVQDSSIGIVSEIDGVNRTIGDMASVLTRTTVLMNKQLAGLRSEFKGVAASIKTSADESATASEHMHKALDFASLMIAGQEFKDFGEKIVGFFAESVKSASEFSQAIANTRAALDAQPGAIAASNAEMTKMQDLALKIGSSGFYSANQVAEAMSTLARNGLHASSIMQGAIQQTSNVAAANQADIDETSMTISDIFNELGSNIVKQFHGNVSQAFNYIGNVMTRTLHSSKISMQDLFTTMKYSGATASNAGLSFADLGGAIALLGSRSIRGSTA